MNHKAKHDFQYFVQLVSHELQIILSMNIDITHENSIEHGFLAKDLSLHCKIKLGYFNELVLSSKTFKKCLVHSSSLISLVKVLVVKL